MERTEKGNAELHDFYQGIYAKDKNRHFLKYRDGKILSEAHEKVIAWLREGGPRHDEVLDFGCGEADFLGHFPPGPRRVGIDYSENAIANAKAKYPGLELVCGLEKDISSPSPPAWTWCSPSACWSTWTILDPPWAASSPAPRTMASSSSRVRPS